jgi:hydroxymethylpyrimidine pyrophosphatase-like HAD family hydrolase
MHYLALATDYDGTLAQNGHVDDDTLGALVRLRDAGRKIILVTGRELPELEAAFPQLGVCDVVVAENGGLLYFPDEDREEVLAEPPPEALVAEMSRLDVKPFSVGRVLIATWRPHETQILEALQRLGIGYQIIFNKKSVMVLPANVNKATGLSAALARLNVAAEQVVGVGDAENDHAFLDMCGVAAAVDNALEAIKERCDLVLAGDHGRGVIELAGRLLDDDLASLGRRRPRAKAAARSIPHKFHSPDTRT